MNTIENFRCPECGDQYNDYDGAYQCIIDCLLENRDEPEKIIKYQCETCSKQYDEEIKAKECEESCLNPDPFELAKKHPHQRRLEYD